MVKKEIIYKDIGGVPIKPKGFQKSTLTIPTMAERREGAAPKEVYIERKWAMVKVAWDNLRRREPET